MEAGEAEQKIEVSASARMDLRREAIDAIEAFLHAMVQTGLIEHYSNSYEPGVWEEAPSGSKGLSSKGLTKIGYREGYGDEEE